MSETVETAPTGPLTEGTVIDGRYRVEALAGSGGYARVYRAHDQQLDRRVALKVFGAVAADHSDAARIASETRLLASVAHPSLVTLFDAKLDANPSFLAMEFIDGTTLRKRIAAGPLAPHEAAPLAAELAEALHVIHARGIVHRDVKPSNVLLRPAAVPNGAPRATLADFGIAYLVDSARVTQTGMLVGTAAYLSPEQARGETPTPSTDVYALGLVLLEALTGRRAYAHATPQEALIARLTRSPEIPADLPEDWRGLLAAMTAKDAAHRPDAHAVLRAADRLRSTGGRPLAPPTPAVLPTAPTLVAPPTETDAAPRRTPWRRRWAWIAAGMLLGVIAVVVAVTAASLGAAPPEPTATLPALPEPLGEHLRQLLDQVDP
jgi:serine/threonine protein kinase